MKKGLILVLTVVVGLAGAVSAGTYSGGGNGSAEKPYRISTPADMNNIGAHPNDWDKHFVLTNNIDLAAYTSTQFSIIGRYYGYRNPNNKPFTGVFDGNNHTIGNFTYTTTGTDYIGLFGYVDDANAVIKDLTLINPNVNAAGDSDRVASLVGYLKGGTITGCGIDGGSVTGGRYCAGGLVGNNFYGTISNCRSSASVTGGAATGGLVGRSYGTIENCYAAAGITGTGYYTGGLVGDNRSGTISSCYAAGNVTGNYNTGGLVGVNVYGTVENCYAEGNVSGTKYTGGLVGGNSGSISNCYATGSVTGNYYIGGLVGDNWGRILNCYAAGSVTGNYNTGGLVGWDECDKISASFWDIEIGGPDNGIGTGLPTSQMQTKSTFTDAGWDFITPIWIIRDGLDYPRLWWMVIYVDDDAAPNGDGTSWASAYNYLQDGLSAASSGYEIRVAQGTYIPDKNSADPNGSGDRNATFRLKSGVAIIGGYAGLGEPDPNIRDVETYETVLSGDLDGDDVEVAEPCDLLLEPTRGENSYHVVTTVGTDNSCVLDGFTITGGNANGDYIPLYWGGGIYNENPPTQDFECTTSGPTITNCRIIKNSAASEGGGMYNRYSCQPQIIDCVFIENMASWGGGGIKNDTSNPVIARCNFTSNYAGSAGAIDNEGSSPTVINSVFIENSADQRGGAIENWMGGCSPSMLNCLFYDNSAEFGGVMCTSNFHQIGDGSHPELVNCTLAGNSAVYGNALACTKGFDVIPSNIRLTNCILWDGGNEIWNNDNSTITIDYSDIQGGFPGVGNIDIAPCFVDAANGDYHLLPGSPCIDAGDPNYIPEPNETDLDGRPRVIGGRIDMGAYESWPPIEAQLRVFPEVIVRHSRQKNILAWIRLPEGITKEQISDEPIQLRPGEIEAVNQYVIEHGRKGHKRTSVLAFFGKAELMNAVLDNGEVELEAVGSLTSGRYFYGTDTVLIKARRYRPSRRWRFN